MTTKTETTTTTANKPNEDDPDYTESSGEEREIPESLAKYDKELQGKWFYEFGFYDIYIDKEADPMVLMFSEEDVASKVKSCQLKELTPDEMADFEKKYHSEGAKHGDGEDAPAVDPNVKDFTPALIGTFEKDSETVIYFDIRQIARSTDIIKSYLIEDKKELDHRKSEWNRKNNERYENAKKRKEDRDNAYKEKMKNYEDRKKKHETGDKKDEKFTEKEPEKWDTPDPVKDEEPDWNPRVFEASKYRKKAPKKPFFDRIKLMCSRCGRKEKKKEDEDHSIKD